MISENATREAAECAMKEGSASLQSRDFEPALESFHRAADLYGQLGDPKRLADGLNMVGGVLAQIDRAAEALVVFSDVIDLLSDEPKSRARSIALSNSGLILVRQKQFQNALGCFEKALALYQQRDEPIRIAEQWGNIGTAYRDLEQPDRAIESYQHALAIYRELDQKERIGDQLTNIAYARIMQQKSADAVRWYGEALSHYAAAGSDKKVRSTIENIDAVEAAMGISRCINC